MGFPPKAARNSMCDIFLGFQCGLTLHLKINIGQVFTHGENETWTSHALGIPGFTCQLNLQQSTQASLSYSVHHHSGPMEGCLPQV